MAKYIGILEVVAGKYTNFKPLAEITPNGSAETIDDADRVRLLPKSKYMNIYIKYKFNTYTEMYAERSKSMLQDGRLLILEFENADREFEENTGPTGELNSTGYIADFVSFYTNDKLKDLNDEGFYECYDAKGADIANNPLLEIEGRTFTAKSKILYGYRKDFYVGPIEVGTKVQSDKSYLNFNVKNNKYLLSGYKASDLREVVIEDRETKFGNEDPKFKWVVYSIKKNAKQQQIDVITDSVLLDAFTTQITKDLPGAEKISVADLPSLLDRYSSSILFGQNVPEEISVKRKKRLLEIIGATINNREVTGEVAESLVAALSDHPENEKIQDFVSQVLEQKPELLDKLKGVKAATDKINALSAEIESLQEQKSDIQEEIQFLRDDSSRVAKATESEELAKRSKELEDVCTKLGIANNADALQKKLDSLIGENQYYERAISEKQRQTEKLNREIHDISKKIDGYFNSTQDKMLDVAFEGVIASNIMKAAATWNQEQEDNSFKEYVKRLNEISSLVVPEEELIDRIVNAIKCERDYTRNDIVNILTCVFQSRITVFSGEPGIGKTSMCKILARTFGLNKFTDTIAEENGINPNRFIEVSVEKGWTSKRDLIGYFNPLTNSMDEANHDVFNAVKILDCEIKEDCCKFPLMILLDEANLSPMEYYWADFMNLCDNMEEGGSINLGGNHSYRIPETLRFVTTINTDFTTEVLSPRLIDRAWVITLPQNAAILTNANKAEAPEAPVGWDVIKTVFLGSSGEMPAEIKETYYKIANHFKKSGTSISPRVEMAIGRYCTVASKWMETDDLGVDPMTNALDYAVAQKLLPKIQGHGIQYKEWIEALKAICDSESLTRSSDILADIVSRGQLQMDYYQFFY